MLIQADISGKQTYHLKWLFNFWNTTSKKKTQTPKIIYSEWTNRSGTWIITHITSLKISYDYVVLCIFPFKDLLLMLLPTGYQYRPKQQIKNTLSSINS